MESEKKLKIVLEDDHYWQNLAMTELMQNKLLQDDFYMMAERACIFEQLLAQQIYEVNHSAIVRLAEKLNHSEMTSLRVRLSAALKKLTEAERFSENAAHRIDHLWKINDMHCYEKDALKQELAKLKDTAKPLESSAPLPPG